MFLIASDAPTGGAPSGTGSQVAALGPDGKVYLLNLDAAGNLLVTLSGGATAANQVQELAKMTAIASALSGTLATTTEGAAAARAGTSFRASTGPVPIALASAIGVTLPTAPVPVALFSVPGSATVSAYLDARTLSANASGTFFVTRTPAVTAAGVAVQAVNLNAGKTAAPQATLAQGGGSPAIAATGGKVEATPMNGSLGTLWEPVAGREVIAPGHSLLVGFLPSSLLAFAIFASAAFDWREGPTS